MKAESTRNTSKTAAWLVVATSLAFLAAIAPAGAQSSDGYKLPRPSISEAAQGESRFAEVLGSLMHYRSLGTGDPVLFIHGNPTSSYLWRNVMPHVASSRQAIAVDLIGMGRSDKPGIAYSYADHYRFLDAFINKLDLRNLTLVVHDWGAALGFDFARRNPGRVRAIAFMEGVLPPAFPQPSFEAMGPEMGGMFRAFKDPEQGRQLVVEQNMFVEQILPGFVNRPLGSEAMEAYRGPFANKADRAPVLAWPRQVPIAGEPADVVTTFGALARFMGETDLPMLLLYADPGVLVPPRAVPGYVSTIRNLETAFVGQGFHFIQEDQPDAIGRAIADWLRRSRR